MARARAQGLVNNNATEAEKEKPTKKKKKKEKVKLKLKKKEATPTRTVSSPQRIVTAEKVAKTQVSRSKSTPVKLSKTATPTKAANVEKESPPVPRTASAQRHAPVLRSAGVESREAVSRIASAEKKIPDAEAGVKTPVSLSSQSSSTALHTPTLSTTRLTLPPAGSHVPANAHPQLGTRSLISTFNGVANGHNASPSLSPARSALFR